MGQTEAQKRYLARKYEESPMIECVCGCGTMIKAVGRNGKPRRFLNGHNSRKPGSAKERKKLWTRNNRAKLWTAEKRRLRRKKVELLLMKGGKCSVCGLEYDERNASLFEFHHRNPEEKCFAVNVSGIKSHSWQKVLTEAEKCDIMCANCHSMFHSEEY